MPFTTILILPETKHDAAWSINRGIIMLSKSQKEDIK